MKFVRKRRGISYIMEVVMMTLVITALATVVLTWGLGVVGDSRSAITGAVNARMQRMQEALVIEDAQMIDASHLRLWIRSSGSTQLVIDQVYLNNVQVTVVGVCSPGTAAPSPPSLCPPGTKLSLPMQAVGAVDVSVPVAVSSCTGGPVCAGNSYNTVAATTHGTEFQGSFTV